MSGGGEKSKHRQSDPGRPLRRTAVEGVQGTRLLEQKLGERALRDELLNFPRGHVDNRHALEVFVPQELEDVEQGGASRQRAKRIALWAAGCPSSREEGVRTVGRRQRGGETQRAPRRTAERLDASAAVSGALRLAHSRSSRRLRNVSGASTSGAEVLCSDATTCATTSAVSRNPVYFCAT